jgi:SAM-dependent methyltransferase
VALPETRPGILRDALAWWRSGVRSQGFIRTAQTFVHEMRDFVRHSLPSRRRQRYGDVDYDWQHRVDTTGATVSFRSRLLGVFHSAYQPTDEPSFREMIGGLGIDYSQFTFIDLGSGKGRTLLMAADYHFRRIVGVELIPELDSIAQENIRNFQRNGRGTAAIASVCADAQFFEFPPEPAVLYLFHPFPEPVLKKVIGRLQQSLSLHPRMFYVIYYNPLLEHVLQDASSLKLLRRQAPLYAIYVNAA